jgi:hypothetical protein
MTMNSPHTTPERPSAGFMVLGLVASVFGTVFRAFGCGWTLLGYRKVADGVYEVTRWFRVVYLPVWPSGSMLIEPMTASSLNLGSVVQTDFQHRLIENRPRNMRSILRTLTTAWVVVPGPMVVSIMAAKSVAPGGSPFGTMITLSGLAWFLGWIFYLNHLRERLYDFKDAPRKPRL